MAWRIVIYLLLAAAAAAVGYLLTLSYEGDDERPVHREVESAEKIQADKTWNKALRFEDGGGTGQETSFDFVRVESVKGTVDRNRGDGVWQKVERGQTLAVDESLRTVADSSVSLRMGNQSTIELAEESEVQVRELSETVQRLGLVKGRAFVDFSEGRDRVLKIENDSGNTIASVNNGSFTVLNTGLTVAVATHTGKVDLFANGETVEVPSGYQSVASDGAPSSPMTIPAEIILKVADPGCLTQREPVYVMRGKVTPGSSVMVNDEPIAVSDNGDFTAHVRLKLGRNRISVVTRDVMGRIKKRTFPCITVDPSAKVEKVEIKWGATSKQHT